MVSGGFRIECERLSATGSDVLGERSDSNRESLGVSCVPKLGDEAASRLSGRDFLELYLEEGWARDDEPRARAVLRPSSFDWSCGGLR
jgi:hypothetical protein